MAPRRLALVLLPLVVLLAGCTGRACSEVGAYSGVTFGYGRVVEELPGVLLTMTTCIEDRCRSYDLKVDDGHELMVTDARIDDDDPVRVSFTIASQDGRTLFEGRQTVEPRRTHPNGPGCDPDVWQATVVASGTDSLQVRP